MAFSSRLAKDAPMTSLPRGTDLSTGAGPLSTRFGPLFKRIAQHGAERDRTRALPYEAIGWLKEAGFGALRVPVARGGSGVTLPQLFALIVELGAADSNLPQALR